MVESSGVPGLAFARASRRAEPPRPNAFLEECSRETTGLCGPSRRLLGLLSGGFMRDREIVLLKDRSAAPSLSALHSLQTQFHT